MPRHITSVEKIVGQNNLYYHEFDVASSIGGIYTNKRLRGRTSISKSGQVDTMFLVYDLSQPQDHQIVLISSSLHLAIDRYNEL